METLAKDKEKRISMGQAGRRLISNNYSQQVVAGKFYDFFKQL